MNDCKEKSFWYSLAMAFASYALWPFAIVFVALSCVFLILILLITWPFAPFLVNDKPEENEPNDREE